MSNSFSTWNWAIPLWGRYVVVTLYHWCFQPFFLCTRHKHTFFLKNKKHPVLSSYHIYSCIPCYCIFKTNRQRPPNDAVVISSSSFNPTLNTLNSRPPPRPTNQRPCANNPCGSNAKCAEKGGRAVSNWREISMVIKILSILWFID